MTSARHGDCRPAALEYRARGFSVTPTTGKAPVLDDWPNVLLDEEAVSKAFRPDHNVGVLLGPSGLADLDFDDPAAVAALRALAPRELDGAAVFEHASRPHLILRSVVKTKRYRRANGSTLLELRGDGCQTVFPPSIHPDGLPYVWIKDTAPPEADPSRLETLALWIATVAYASEFWTEGSRHDLALALAGFLGRRLDEADVVVIVRAVATVAKDAEIADREGAVATTVRRLKTGDQVVGLPTLDGLCPELARALASWWSDASELAQAPQPRSPLSQADRLVELGRTAELFHDGTGTPFARLLLKGHREVWPVQSRTFRNWLRHGFYSQLGKTPGTDAVNAASGVLEGLASFEGPAYELHNRVAWHQGSIYYDLTDAAWRAVRISDDGWQITEHPPVLFRRYAQQKEQVEPVAGGDLAGVLDFLNVRADDQLLLLVWLVASCIPDIPHPIPDFHGEKGAGKSVGQRVLRRLIDPSRMESLAFPADVRELVQQLSHHYAPIFDNVDNLPPWISDLLCRAVTGEGFSKRELFSDDDDIIYSYRRVIMLNGINVVARRPDLLDRSILIGLERISRSERKEERWFWERFEAVRPAILGAIFNTLSAALRIYPTLQLSSMERMADFTSWGTAIAQAMGYGADAFRRAYASNLGVQTEEAVRGHIVGAAVLALMQDKPEWTGTPTELLEALELAGQEARLFKRSASGRVDARGWPGAAHILSRRLNEIRSNLADLGLGVTGDRDNARTVTIRRVTPEGGETSGGSDDGVGAIQKHLLPYDGTDATDAISSISGGEEYETVIS